MTLRATTLASSAAMVVLVLRGPVRHWLGASATYLLWLAVPVALAAVMLPVAADDCTGAVRVEAVPVTLPYAFTFEIVKGQAKVRLGEAPR
ncbi:M56 family metallopeptidase [Stenotrophomonas sp. YIM B06876]|uniref:M56 family metallopeptidase n=1 Tax=Stenotrophomonas sp. YIM B06876 TaxID=3060211 RepID=UPI002738EDA7|nr:M56 family metallopeptidase [Stenotrophomonas sp. YIM B06876]